MPQLCLTWRTVLVSLMMPASLKRASVLLTVRPTIRLEMVMVMRNRKHINRNWAVPLLPLVDFGGEEIVVAGNNDFLFAHCRLYFNLVPGEVALEVIFSNHHHQHLDRDDYMIGNVFTLVL